MPISLEQWRAAVGRWVARIQRALIIRRGVKRPPSCDSSQEGAPSPSGQPHSGEKKCMVKKKGRKKCKDELAITTDDFYDGMIALAAIVTYLGKTEYKHSFDTTPVGPLKELLGYPGVGALLVVIMILLLRSGDVEENPGPVERDMDHDFTKCVTIRQSESSDPASTNPQPEKWMKCFKVVANQAAQELSLSSRDDWHNMGNSQVLLHIDTEQPQVQILPFLFTQVHCVYLVVFDLKDHARALAYIRFAMQNIVACTLCCTRSEKADEQRPKVYLVCMHSDCKDMCTFEAELDHELQGCYKELIMCNNKRLCWDVGADLDIQNTDDLAEHIKKHSSRLEGHVCNWIGYYCDLPTEAKVMVYSDVKDKMLRTLREEDFDKCLAFLHNYGFIFYAAFDDFKQEDSKNAVVLQPQFLCSVINEIQKLCKDKDEDKASIGDFFSQNGARGPIRDCMQEWFQRVCTNKGLAIEDPTNGRNDFLFICPNPKPTREIKYSVDPLLLAFNHENEHIVPVAAFAKFVSCLLRELQKRELQQREQKKTKQGNPLRIQKLNQHTVHISMQGGRSHIHVIERESYLEIGIQLLHIEFYQDENNTLRNLRELCEYVMDIVTYFQPDFVTQLQLIDTKVYYGFNPRCGMHCFAQYHEGKDGQYHLSCVGTRCPLQLLRPEQKIWLKAVSTEQVSLVNLTNADYSNKVVTLQPHSNDPNEQPAQNSKQNQAGANMGPMKKWNKEALIALTAELEEYVIVANGLCAILQKSAGGFMSGMEAQVVTSKQNNAEQMGELIKILLGKGDADFGTFCMMLRDVNYEVWANMLEEKAGEFKSKSGHPQQISPREPTPPFAVPTATVQVPAESTQPVTAPPPGATAQVPMESTQPLTALPHESKPLPPGVTSSCLVVAQPNVTPDDKTYPTPISNWLAGLKLESYAELFQGAGYDTTDFLVGISEDDLRQLGMSKDGHRKWLWRSLQKHKPEDRQPKVLPADVPAWLREIGLSQYESALMNKGYDVLEFLEIITEEELNNVGMTKQGHVRKFFRSLTVLANLLEGREH